MDPLLSEEQLADRYGKKPETIRDWRKKRKGPRPTKIGGTVFYSEADIKKWEAAAKADDWPESA